MKHSTLTLSLDLGILGEQSAEVTFYYWPGFTGTHEDPPEPEYVDIETVTIVALEGESLELENWLDSDALSTLEQRVLTQFLAEAESAATEAAIDRFEERERYETE